MSKIFENEIKTMQRLMNYGLNENKSNDKQSVVEYHATAADGKTYGIIRECNKFYIKVAPKKDTEVLAEDYDYIGGFNNKKENEYTSYASAANHFDLKMKSINEAYDNGAKYQRSNATQPAEWQINETKEMRKEIERYNQLVNNVNAILTEGSIPSEHTTPESPKSSSKNVSAPFTDTAVAKGDKDMKDTKSDYKNAGSPFSQGGVVTNKDLQSDKAPKGKGDETYKESPKFGPKFDKDSVASKSLKEGKVIKLSEAQVLAWNKDKDFMDKSHGTEIGDTAPYDEDVDTIYEEVAVHNTDDQDRPTPGTSETGDPAPFTNKVNESEVEPDDAMGFEDDDLPEDDGDFELELEPEDEEGDVEIDLDADELPEEEFDADERAADAAASRNARNISDREIDDLLKNWNQFDDDFDDDGFYESRRRRGRRVNEAYVLSDFGKHPAYRKKVMTTPPNTEIDRWGRDWNDDSAKGDEPFGKKIGKSDPYTEKVINMLTDAVVDQLTSKKKA